MSRPERRVEIARLREEGRAAYEAGRHVQTCPYKEADRFQWESGWYGAQEDQRAQAGEVAHVLFCNDVAERVLIGSTEAQRERYLEAQRAEHQKETTTALGKDDPRVQHYRNVYYWHYHEVKIERF